MMEINLLPWREKKREREKKEINTYLLVAAIAAAGMVFLMNMYAKQLVEDQTYSNKVLEKEIKILDKQIEEIANLKKLRDALIARMKVVQNLQATRSLTVRLFDELIKVMPDGVYLTSMERKGNTIILLGYAESNTNISQLMKNIESDKWIQQPMLTEIKRSDEEGGTIENEFKLSFTLSALSELDNEH